MKLRAFTILIGAALALAACATAGDRVDDRLKLIDLTGEAARAWDETQSLPDPERVAAFKAHFATILPLFA